VETGRLDKKMNEINKDIRNQIRIAIKLGIHIPDFIKLDSFADKEKAQLNHHVFIRGQYAFEKTLGVKIGYCAYYNGTRFVNFTGMCLDSFMFSGEQGFELDSNISMFFGIDYKKSYPLYAKLDAFIKEEYPEYIGFVQINVFMTPDKEFWYDSIVFDTSTETKLCYSNLISSDIYDDEIDYSQPSFFANRYSATLRLFPMGWPDITLTNEDVHFYENIWSIYFLSDLNCFVVSAHGETIKEVWQKIQHKCSGLERFNFLYRIDGMTICKKLFHFVKINELL